MEYVGIGVLKSILMQKRCRVVLRYLFYDMKNQTMDFGISSPPELKYWNSCVGWCARGVDALADRMDFYGFRDDVFGLAEIYDANNRDILFPSAIQGALIAGCSFIYISEDEYGYPRLQAINADDATGIVNPITGLLNEGYAVLERDMAGLPVKEAYFTHEYTAYYENGTLVDSREYAIKEPMLVPMVFRPDAKRVFGHSRITRSCMSQVCSALRTIKRSEISAEFYSFPQKYVTGVDQDAEQIDKWSAAMSAMMKFTLGEDGQDHVKLGQFTQQSMQPHIEQLKMFASLFASEVGLTLDDLGFPSANPSSYDAIRASHENLRLTARAAQKSFNVGILNAGYLAACIRDRYAYTRQQITVERPVWLPPFRADVSMLSGIGDALQKINGAYPEYLTEDKILELTGF
ncbi:MAG: phage portal protein [Clostridiales bacterium]|nr:phage portal protein [Clostridiales bacterium]MBQ1298152.1 phage portal protein [Clostridiales bacterium]MBQ1572653.1 phage portal protein [Clostridiales bacterium]MBQ1575272.1 phage portal protein [Clostridiales bacterium]